MMVINIHDSLGIGRLINLDNVNVMESTVNGDVIFEFVDGRRLAVHVGNHHHAENVFCELNEITNATPVNQ
ncbi:TPA: hypothetical protein JXT23_004534 [Escherichia coli]|uniref:Uncharacterized protein n=2 Tax=Salmonella enterica subsp. enterica serovar Adelaide TaxID=29473 RepID=A0A6C8GLC0_SALET|nr:MULTISPECIES: hypothetical protein [Escherichia]EAB1830286.1 hypothetical protein [Salmonella enterica]EAM6834381.1 hypothetical protein [Salmonella enterica subsp. enterica serovar Adelaide]EDB2642662.1 hypothetical protein [Salmonella enterica subsp. enterica]EDP8598042.1 hypothetical protein [Salmonella bongori]EEZ5658684.1 hypothetical protein [Escherichia coli O5]EFA4234122.1 hypothetical protein [Escherichia coli O40:H32]EGU9840538.1 hypothetical protein [Salmonella enterica subsp. 